MLRYRIYFTVVLPRTLVILLTVVTSVVIQQNAIAHVTSRAALHQKWHLQYKALHKKAYKHNTEAKHGSLFTFPLSQAHSLNDSSTAPCHDAARLLRGCAVHHRVSQTGRTFHEDRTFHESRL